VISESHKDITQIIDREEIDVSYSEETDFRSQIDSELSKLIDEFEREEVKSVVGQIYAHSGDPNSVLEAFIKIYLDPVDEALTEKEDQLAKINDILSIANQEGNEFSQKRELVSDPTDIPLRSLEDANVNEPKNGLFLEEGYIQRIITDYPMLDETDISETGLIEEAGEREIINEFLQKFAHNILSKKYMPLNIPVNKDMCEHYHDVNKDSEDPEPSFRHGDGDFTLSLIRVE
jgi:DNA repair exonuclease SbcCD nuclease subunit